MKHFEAWLWKEMAIWKTACYNGKVKWYFRKSLSPWTLYNLSNTVLGFNSIIAINLNKIKSITKYDVFRVRN